MQKKSFIMINHFYNFFKALFSQDKIKFFLFYLPTYNVTSFDILYKVISGYILKICKFNSNNPPQKIKFKLSFPLSFFTFPSLVLDNKSSLYPYILPNYIYNYTQGPYKSLFYFFISLTKMERA